MIDNPQGTFRILHAGALHQAMGNCLELFSKQHPELLTEMEGTGSRDGARRVLAGTHYDVIALADQALFAELLAPDLVENYLVFATDQIVIGYDKFSRFSKEINRDNWMDILLQPETVCARSDHNLDPCGYRTLMVWQLAEKFYNRPGFFAGMDAHCNLIYPKSIDLAGALLKGHSDFAFLYSSEAKQLGLPYIILPSKINLSNPAYANFYDQATVTMESKTPGQNIIIHGKPVEFAVGIPKNALHPDLASNFVNLLTGSEGSLILEEAGLISC